MKKYFVLTVLIACLLIGQNAFAQIPNPLEPEPDPLEVDYPDIPAPGHTPESVETTPITRYVEYVFYFLIGMSSLLAVLTLIYAGFKYLTAVGNPDKLKDAKNKMISALLGLAIIAGSFVILQRINPQFLVFDIKPIDPLINTMSPGVLACKEDNRDPLVAWTLEQIYLLGHIPAYILEPDLLSQVMQQIAKGGIKVLDINSNNEEAQLEAKKQIQQELDRLHKKISQECYYVNSAGKVRSDFNDKIKKIWFLPDLEYKDEGGTKEVSISAKYGAAIFDNDDYTGLGNLYIMHMAPEGIPSQPISFGFVDWFLPRHIKISSIKPFKGNWNSFDVLDWTVKLYEYKEYNAGTDKPEEPFWEMDIIRAMLAGTFHYYGYEDPDDHTKISPIPLLVDLPEDQALVAPQSMRIDGDIMVALYREVVDWENLDVKDEIEKDGQKGRYFEIFFDNDNNLENNSNIVDWVACFDYKSDEKKENCIPIEPMGGLSGVVHYIDCCAKPAVDAIVIWPDLTPL